MDGVTARTALVVATTNRGKLAELRALLADLPVDALGLDEALPERITVAEDGDTFEANAIHKAQVIASVTQMLTLADDSGLEVDALGGRPGVRSARFAGPRATDAENNAALLAALGELEEGEPRRARFRCVLALVDPWAPPGAPPVTIDGRCEGFIARTPHGTGGFGYDPLFVVEERGCSMAELPEADKNALSHRGRAFARLRPLLAELLARRAAEAAGLV